MYIKLSRPLNIVVAIAVFSALGLVFATSIPSNIVSAHGIDADGDGWAVIHGDCDDNNSFIFPIAVDIPGDGIDQDCDMVDAVGTRTSSSTFNLGPFSGGTAFFVIGIAAALALLMGGGWYSRKRSVGTEIG